MKTKILLIIIAFFLIFQGYAQYQRDRKINAAEYFINTDPGEGKATSINIGTLPLWEINAEIKSLNVPVGANIYVRFKSTNNSWSAPMCITKKDYFPNRGANLKYGEYFINHDPGIGSGVSINYDYEGKAELRNLSLKRGDLVYVRFRDSYNRWSPARPVQFNYKEIIGAEYSIKQIKGDSVYPRQMIVEPLLNSSSLFSVYQTGIDRTPFGKENYVYVRVQTSDKIYSPWRKEYVTVPFVSINDIENNDNFKIYPNPFSSSFNIEINPYYKKARLEITNILGQKVFVMDNINPDFNNTVTIQPNGLEPGIYNCTLFSGNGKTGFKKLIKY